MVRRGPVGNMLKCAAPVVAFMAAGSGNRGGGFAEAFLPGLGPKAFDNKTPLPLYVNELTSTIKQAPLDHYHLGYCREEGFKKRGETLGAYLEGEREETSLYDLRVNENAYCQVLCEKALEAGERYMFSNVINDNYRVHMTVNGLPVAYEESKKDLAVDLSSTLDLERNGDSIFSRGFPVGFSDPNSHDTFLYNHLRFTIAIHPVTTERKQFHIVGFIVQPFSVQHLFESPYDRSKMPATCDSTGYSKPNPSFYLSTDFDGQMLFTYDVIWVETNMPWTQRFASVICDFPSRPDDSSDTAYPGWDLYSTGTTDNQIHWFSITNSSVIVMFLTVLVAMIMIRALRKDIQRYNAEDMEEANEESGWKLVHGDVLRPPMTYPMLFAVCVGTGVQLWTVSFMVLFFSMARLVSVFQRGDMLTVGILIYVLTGGIAGYNASRIHRRFRGTEWLKMTMFTALGFPGIIGMIFMVLNLQQWAIGSTGAVPFVVLLQLLALWLVVQTPLVFLGSYYGFRQDPPQQVVRTNQIPRMIPQTPWYVDPKVAVPFAGVLPFGAVLVELVFVMTALWEQQLYFIFGFLLSVMIILTVTCAEISIVMCYFQLCAEDYRWWWRSLLWSGSSAGWMLLYSVGYYITVLKMTGWIAACLFFGYTFILTGSFFLLTGAVGYFSCQWFIDQIYGSIKVD